MTEHDAPGRTDGTDGEGAESGPSSSGHVPQVVEHLFRQESGRLTAALTRWFGFEHLPLAEDVVQEALVRALRLWPYHGVPKDPASWILQVARRLALDVLRREQRFREKEPEVAAGYGSEAGAERQAVSGGFSDDEIRDDQLRMMFVCCHPLLTRDVQVAFTLRTLCGFGVAEVAAAFLASEAAIAKKLVRARQRLREARVTLELPGPGEIAKRMESVLQALYLLFNEGYKASQGDVLVREDLCREAIRLARLLVSHPTGATPRAHALLALMLFNAARLPTRVDAAGQVLLLADQDRKLWDGALIREGMSHLMASAAGDEISEFHLQAGIASLHCLAPDHVSTDWTRILELYDLLRERFPSPVVFLHRAVAVSRVRGPAVGLEALEEAKRDGALEEHYLLAAVEGQLLAECGRVAEAARAFGSAIVRARVATEREFLRARLEALGPTGLSPAPAGGGDATAAD